MGVAAFMGSAGRDIAPGAGVSVKVGYDVFRFVAVALGMRGHSHRALFPDRSFSGQALQQLQGTAELKLGFQLGALGIAAFGGGGFARFSTNLLESAGYVDSPESSASLQPLFMGGLDVSWHPETRQFTFGITGDFIKMPRILTMGQVQAQAYVRHTF